MARARVPITVIDTAGNAVSGAAITVKNRPAGTNATVYQAETGPTTITNPVATNSQGIAPGWVERGAYQADITGTGISPYTEYFEAAPAGAASIDDLWLPPSLDSRLDALEASQAARVTTSASVAGTASVVSLVSAFQALPGMLFTLTSLAVDDIIELWGHVRLDAPVGHGAFCWWHVSPAATPTSNWRLLPEASAVNSGGVAVPVTGRYKVINAGTHRVGVMCNGVGGNGSAAGTLSQGHYTLRKAAGYTATPTLIAPTVSTVAI